jgi:hypothetical protein
MASSSNPEPSMEERITDMQNELDRIKELVKEQTKLMLSLDTVGENRLGISESRTQIAQRGCRQRSRSSFQRYGKCCRRNAPPDQQARSEGRESLQSLAQRIKAPGEF